MSQPSPSLQPQNTTSSGVLTSNHAHLTPDVRRPQLVALERYRLSCLLGRGGMAEVFLAAWQVAPEVVRPVVVKRLYSHFSDDSTLVRMFIDEARLVCQLDHENIVKTYEVGLIDEHLCIAMEYLEGQTLQQLMRRSWEHGGIPVPLAVHIATKVLRALRFAHDATDRQGQRFEIVHRDISPHNIFITNAGEVKVLDFGIAKATSHEQRTLTGVVKGKFAYIAPEQAAGHCTDGRADLWSLGVVLWEMLSGRRLFKADGEAATLNATMHREVPLLSKIRSEIPMDLSMAVSRALQRNPDYRYPDAVSMLRDLERHLGREVPRPDAALVSSFMQRLFAQEINHQQQLVGDLILLHEAQLPPSSISPSVTDMPAIAEDRQSTTGTEVDLLVRQMRRSQRTTVGILGALVAVLLVMSAWLLHLQGKTGASAEPAARRDGRFAAGAVPAGPATAPTVAEHKAGANAESEIEGPRAAAFVAVAPVALAPTALAPTATPAKPVAAKAKSRPIKVVVPESTASTSSGTTEEWGFLTIDTTPWSNVSIKGRLLGATPIIGAKLPVGNQLLTLRNPDLGIETQYSVNIAAKQTVVKRIGIK